MKKLVVVNDNSCEFDGEFSGCLGEAKDPFWESIPDDELVLVALTFPRRHTGWFYRNHLTAVDGAVVLRLDPELDRLPTENLGS